MNFEKLTPADTAEKNEPIENEKLSELNFEIPETREMSPEDIERIKQIKEDLGNLSKKDTPVDISSKDVSIETTSSERGNHDEVIGVASYPFPLASLWDLANSPTKFAPYTPNLSHYETDSEIKKGSHIVEEHYFDPIGISTQRYEGSIMSYDDQESWSMYTKPVGFSKYLYGLAHFVKYSFEDDGNGGSRLTIRVEHKATGILSIPFIRTRVLERMEKVVAQLLEVPMKAYSKK